MTQPELIDAWGCTFYGTAERTGSLYYYIGNDGRKHPLRPKRIIASEEFSEHVEEEIRKVVL